MRVLFIGTVSFSKEMLLTLIDCQANIVGVVTSENTGINSDYADLTPLCETHRIPVHKVRNINSESSLDWIKKKAPDIVFCFGWSRLLKAPLLNIPPFGVVGYHPTALPLNRGRHPLIWTIFLGLQASASTFFFMDDGADSGDILDQKTFEVSNEETAGSLYAKMVRVAKTQVVDFFPRLCNGSFQRIPQKGLYTNTWRKRGHSDGQIDFRMSAVTIDRLVRALTTPYVGAHIVYKGNDIKVWACRLETLGDNIAHEPGKVISITHDGYPVIQCGVNAIILTQTEPRISLELGEYL